MRTQSYLYLVCLSVSCLNWPLTIAKKNNSYLTKIHRNLNKYLEFKLKTRTCIKTTALGFHLGPEISGRQRLLIFKGETPPSAAGRMGQALSSCVYRTQIGEQAESALQMNACLASLGYRTQASALVLGFQPEASLLQSYWPSEYLLNLSDKWPLSSDQDAHPITFHLGRFSTIKKFCFIFWIALGCLLAAFSLTLYSKTLILPRVRHFISHLHFSLVVLLYFICYFISLFLKYTWRVSHWWSKT